MTSCTNRPATERPLYVIYSVGLYTCTSIRIHVHECVLFACRNRPEPGFLPQHGRAATVHLCLAHQTGKHSFQCQPMHTVCSVISCSCDTGMNLRQILKPEDNYLVPLSTH